MKPVTVFAPLVVLVAGGYLAYQLGLVDLIGGAGSASNVEVCKKARPLTAPTLAETYAFSAGLARGWKPDAVLERLDHTPTTPLQPTGSSTGWTAGFYSAAAKRGMLIHTGNGELQCSTHRGEPDRIAALKPDFMRDGAALYRLAEKHGQALLAKGYGVRVYLWTAGDNHAMWHVTYSKADGEPAGLRLVVDANSGALEEVVKLNP